MYPVYERADKLSSEVIGAAIEVHRHKGPGLIESIYALHVTGKGIGVFAFAKLFKQPSRHA
jgi:hypothetical protein